ncbi:glutamyl-tRNA synthetase [Sesbania bispinosa]|nr:glutamyl-tRNA synthetase [Sesbania bispinosa]
MLSHQRWRRVVSEGEEDGEEEGVGEVKREGEGIGGFSRHRWGSCGGATAMGMAPTSGHDKIHVPIEPLFNNIIKYSIW